MKLCCIDFGSLVQGQGRQHFFLVFMPDLLLLPKVYGLFKLLSTLYNGLNYFYQIHVKLSLFKDSRLTAKMKLQSEPPRKFKIMREW